VESSALDQELNRIYDRPMTADIASVLDWWFGDLATTPDAIAVKATRWFREGAKLDPVIREKFGALVETAMGGGLREWETTLEGRVALIILLDQFSRHVYRDQARMYAGDPRAQKLSKALFDSGEGQRLRLDWRHFAMMPMLHAEDVALQRRSVEEMDAIVKDAAPELRSFYALGIQQSRKYLDVVTRFGRFPHRNAILGRESTPEEKTFMTTFVGPPTERG
jgi:uncharacterized protein (DUF924 family)